MNRQTGWAIFIAAAMLSLLTACGGQGEEAAAPAPATGAPAPAETGEPPSYADAFAALPVPYSAADYTRARRNWRLCSSCHLVDPEAGHRVGPNLHGMFGREVGVAEGFAYSEALQEADFIWTPELLEEWLANPRDFLPGNRMTFAGIRREEDRHAVIAYLMVESGWQPSGE